jgi:hypothetical protein
MTIDEYDKAMRLSNDLSVRCTLRGRVRLLGVERIIYYELDIVSCTMNSIVSIDKLKCSPNFVLRAICRG